MDVKQLIYPKSFNEWQSRCADEVLSSKSDSVAQLLLDELSGRMEYVDIKNPIAYLKKLVWLYDNDKLEPTAALDVQARRKHRLQVQKNVEISNDLAEQEALQLLGVLPNDKKK